MGNQTTNDAKPRRSRLALRVGLTLGLLAILATQIDHVELIEAFTGLHWALIAIAAMLALLDRILATYRWWLLLTAREVPVRLVSLSRFESSAAPQSPDVPTGDSGPMSPFRRIPFGWLLLLHLHASFLGGFLPTTFSVDAVRIFMLAQATGRTWECVASSVVDRAVMLLCNFAIAAPCAVVATWLLISPEAGMIAAIALAAVTVGLAVAAVSGAIGLVLRSWVRVRAVLGERLGGAADRFEEALSVYRRTPGALAAAVGITLVMLLVRFGFFVILAWSVGASPNILLLAVIAPIIWVVLMVPLSIGGFGQQEAVYALLLGTVGVVSGAAVAVSMSLLEHLIVRLVTVPAAIAWTIQGSSSLRGVRDSPAVIGSCKASSSQETAQ